MDAVLGVSMTPSTVSLVLVEGHDADGVTIGHEVLDVAVGDGARAAATAVVRTESASANQGHRLRAIGVTWTTDADAEATVLLKTLADAGFDNVVPVRLPQANEALAREIADLVGYDTTAVCVIERDAAYASMVNPVRGSIQAAVNHVIVEQDALIDWLGMVFATTNRRPDALVMLGSADGLDAMLPRLQDALDVPVFTPAAAEQPLARGAALASVRRGRVVSAGADARSARRDATRRAPVALLAGGVVTFVGSLSLAIGLQISPQPEPTPNSPRPVASISGSPLAVHPAPPRVAVPAEQETETTPQFVVESTASSAATAPPSEVVAEPPAALPGEPGFGAGAPAELVAPPVDTVAVDAPPPVAPPGPHEIQQQVLPNAGPVPTVVAPGQSSVVPEQPPVVPEQPSAVPEQPPAGLEQPAPAPTEPVPFPAP